MTRIHYLFIGLLTFAMACNSTKKLANSEPVMLDDLEVVGKKHPYRESARRTNDLLHTALDVSFDWEKQYLYGKAMLTLKPYFYETNEVVLDAKGMEIKEVALMKNGSKTPLDYEYSGKLLKITLDRKYVRTENYSLFIEYVSKPNELDKAEGLSAITDDKGLFFINPLGLDKEKPRQIWTQGEPESNSVWFPTIDHPNERCSQEIKMTIENNFLAMSNGVLMSDKDNGDGTHTVYWKQEKPHAPYLFMMAIGEFHETKDSWNGMSVNYYVEDEYAGVAQEIFGKTPRMITFFADQLGVDYAWDKYWQVCVRDYVSGAMENTSMVIFGEFVQRDERELLDENFEDIVSHELYHHWFGDLVTCESWANLPLNESFATYGEVLWREHEFGQDARYRKVYDDAQAYFNEAARGKQVDMIRYHHGTAEEMFDSHSYAKGGTILNMLRAYVGDDAFFESLRVYLEDNKFQSVEIHDLRLAFEKVTGEDMNWFFNQWFLSAGHPVLDITYNHKEDSSFVTISQTPSAEKSLVYEIPMFIDIYDGNNYKREQVVLNQDEQTFGFATSGKPFLINVDAEKSLLAEITDHKTEDNWVFQYMNAKNFMDKVTALENLAVVKNPSKDITDVFKYAMKDDYWYIQELGITLFNITADDTDGVALVKSLAESASKSQVQSAAIDKLSELEDKKFEPVFEKGLQHKSYLVAASALEALMTTNPKRSLEKAAEWETTENFDLKDAISYVYAMEGDASKVPFFEKMATEPKEEWKRYYGIYYYSKLLGRMDKETTLKGFDFIEEYGQNDEGMYATNVAISALKRTQGSWLEKAEEIRSSMNADGVSKSQKMALENELFEIQEVLDSATEGMQRLQGE